MVCHETYKDEKNQWLSPDEIVWEDNQYVKKRDRSKKVKVGPSESMSKSKNVIDPEYIMNNYGADAVRLFILSDSPPEKDVQWSNQGIEAAYKFIQKLWVLHNKFKEKINKNEKEDSNNLEKITNQFIKKVTNNLESFSYNVIIANFHEIYSLLIKEIEKKYSSENLKENFRKILICMLPVIPHFANQCLVELDYKKKIKIEWPSFNEDILLEEKINFVVQVNGKKRGILKLKRDIDEDRILNEIMKNEILLKYVENKTIKKKIFIPNKLINIII